MRGRSTGARKQVAGPTAAEGPGSRGALGGPEVTGSVKSCSRRVLGLCLQGRFP